MDDDEIGEIWMVHFERIKREVYAARAAAFGHPDVLSYCEHLAQPLTDRATRDSVGVVEWSRYRDRRNAAKRRSAARQANKGPTTNQPNSSDPFKTYRRSRKRVSSPT